LEAKRLASMARTAFEGYCHPEESQAVNTKWPTKDQYEAAWKGRERDLTRYYQDAAFAAMERLKVAVEALKTLEAQDSGKPGSTNRADCMAAIARQAIFAIDMPEEP
jgi:hypothetical protein